ncbi:DUF1257 domain-containing protein [Leptodesmis sichuanensis A121]|nr:DUF1257 domain-containing protein [Leptodesmis sichuanensis A121]
MRLPCIPADPNFNADRLIVRQRELLEQAQQFALNALNVGRDLSCATALASNESCIAKHRKTVAKRSEKLRAGTEALEEFLSLVQEAIATDPGQLLPLEAVYNLAVSLLNANLTLLVIASKSWQQSLPVLPPRGHFSTLRTPITDPQLLILSLEQLGLTVEREGDVRGLGQTVKADVVAVLKGDYDIGWSRNADGGFDMIADLWGLSKFQNHEELIKSIYSQYKQNASLI